MGACEKIMAAAQPILGVAPERIRVLVGDEEMRTALADQAADVGVCTKESVSEAMQGLRSRDEWRKLPVIVVSAKDLTPEEKQFLEDATQRVVTKGSDSGQSLLSAIGKAVEDQTQSS